MLACGFAEAAADIVSLFATKIIALMPPLMPASTLMPMMPLSLMLLDFASRHALIVSMMLLRCRYALR